jgi:hypothetical protein
MSSLLGIAYLVVGVVIAADRNYFDHLGNVDNIASAVFAVLAWPLLLLGVDVTLR